VRVTDKPAAIFSPEEADSCDLNHRTEGQGAPEGNDKTTSGKTTKPKRR